MGVQDHLLGSSSMGKSWLEENEETSWIFRDFPYVSRHHKNHCSKCPLMIKSI